jgi:hypothetical protein
VITTIFGEKTMNKSDRVERLQQLISEAAPPDHEDFQGDLTRHTSRKLDSLIGQLERDRAQANGGGKKKKKKGRAEDKPAPDSEGAEPNGEEGEEEDRHKLHLVHWVPRLRYVIAHHPRGPRTCDEQGISLQDFPVNVEQAKGYDTEDLEMYLDALHNLCVNFLHTPDIETAMSLADFRKVRLDAKTAGLEEKTVQVFASIQGEEQFGARRNRILQEMTGEEAAAVLTALRNTQRQGRMAKIALLAGNRRASPKRSRPSPKPARATARAQDQGAPDVSDTPQAATPPAKDIVPPMNTAVAQPPALPAAAPTATAKPAVDDSERVTLADLQKVARLVTNLQTEVSALGTRVEVMQKTPPPRPPDLDPVLGPIRASLNELKNKVAALEKASSGTATTAAVNRVWRWNFQNLRRTHLIWGLIGAVVLVIVAVGVYDLIRRNQVEVNITDEESTVMPDYKPIEPIDFSK